MMEQNKPMDFKTLKAQFQGENNFNVQAKPLIPQKPQTAPLSPTKVSNPLVSSINSAVKKGALNAPRVVFRDDKNLRGQLSPPTGLNEQQFLYNSNLQDNSQMEGDIVKRPIKDRNLPLVLPVPPIKAKTPELEPSPLTPRSVSPAKVSTPKKFVFNTAKTSKDVKADTVENLTPFIEPSPLTPRSVSPARVSAPKRFVFNTTNTGKNVKADTVEIPTPAIRTPENSAPSHQPPANPSITAHAPSARIGQRPIPTIPASNILAPGIPTSASSQPKTPTPAIPTPAIRSQPVRKSETHVSDVPDATSPKPNILSLSEVFPPPKESPPEDFTDIPPPVIPDFLNEDFSEGDIPSSAIHGSITPVSRSPVVSKTPSPALPKRSGVSPELLLKPLEIRSRPSSLSAPSPTPSIEEVLEHSKALNDKTKISKENQSPTKSPLLALARAEEMAPVKRTTPLDNRVFNLLEKAKKKPTMTQLATTPENTNFFKFDLPKIALPDTLTPDLAQRDPEPPEKVMPQVPTIVKTLPVEASTVPEELDITAFPPIDYVDHTQVPKTRPPETAQVNGLNHIQTSPGLLTVVKPVNPPPPPPKKPLPATPNVETPPEKRKPPAQHLKIPTTPAEHLQTYEDQPYDSFEEPSFEDSEEFEAPAVPNFRPVPPLALSSARPTSVHDAAFLDQRNQRHHTAEEMLPNTEGRGYGEVDYGPVNSSSPQPPSISVPQDQARSFPSPFNRDVLLPSGTLENNYEDQVFNKKGKTAKNKKHKGPPKNPYADAAVQETSKKGRFSRKNSEKAVDEKELKKKEKQREKEKEKEKERERKEQKEREKKENEIKKRFGITGQEEAVYQVKVIQDCKGGKNDLPVNTGETVSIIRTSNCPKGKWLAKDSSNRYGYVPVENMDLNMNGIMELGKKAKASNRLNGILGAEEHTSTGSRMSDHYTTNHESFSDDSEEWTCDDDDPTYNSPSETAHIGLSQTPVTPAKVSKSGPVHQSQTDGKYTNAQAQQEALQKLSIFFTQPKTPTQPQQMNNTPKMEGPKPVLSARKENPGNLNDEDEDLDIPVFKVLPPPDLYADIIAGDHMPIYSKLIKTGTK